MSRKIIVQIHGSTIPVARYLKVTARRSAGETEFLIVVSCLAIRGPTFNSNRLNESLSIRKKLRYDILSVDNISGIKRMYAPRLYLTKHNNISRLSITSNGGRGV